MLFFLLFSAFAHDLTEDLSQIKKILEENKAAFLSLEKKTREMGREVKLTAIKATKIVTQLKKTTDVAIYEMFNRELERKCALAESLYKSSVKSLKDQSVPKRILKVIDFYIKRQQVPDEEMHFYLVQFERKIGSLASHVRKVFNLDRVNLALIALFALSMAVYSNVPAKKIHTS